MGVPFWAVAALSADKQAHLLRGVPVDAGGASGE